MSMTKIYHNSRCKKSRAGLQFLSEKTKDFEIVEYLKEESAFTEESLAKLLQQLQKSPMDMIRKQESFFKQEMKGKTFSDDELIKLMVDNPKLIQRPIVVKDGRAVWGDPAEEIGQLF